jgi:hypothetical protein
LSGGRSTIAEKSQRSRGIMEVDVVVMAVAPFTCHNKAQSRRDPPRTRNAWQCDIVASFATADRVCWDQRQAHKAKEG